jgi:hypothetical protein
VTFEGVTYTITDVIIDSTRTFLDGIVITDSEGNLYKYPDPKADDDLIEVSPYVGYHNFQYDAEGRLSEGQYGGRGPMYFLGTPTSGPITTYPDPTDKNSEYGNGYPAIAPGLFFIDDLPKEGEEDIPYVTASFEEMDLSFTIVYATNEKGEATQKHSITYHTRMVG